MCGALNSRVGHHQGRRRRHIDRRPRAATALAPCEFRPGTLLAGQDAWGRTSRMADTRRGVVSSRGFYRQETYDYFKDCDVTIGLSEVALQDLLGRILPPPQDARQEHTRGSFAHIGHIDRYIAVIPTCATDRLVMGDSGVEAWVSAETLSRLLAGLTRDVVSVLRLSVPGGKQSLTVLGERDGFCAACVLWSLMPKSRQKY